jgi:dihydroneopterin aldolase
MARFPAVDEVRVRVLKLKPPIPERIAAAGVELRLTRQEYAQDEFARDA